MVGETLLGFSKGGVKNEEAHDGAVGVPDCEQRILNWFNAFQISSMMQCRHMNTAAYQLPLSTSHCDLMPSRVRNFVDCSTRRQ